MIETRRDAPWPMSTMPDAAGFAERTVRSGEVRLRCVTSGPADGPLVLFLHGFPARWSTWRGILPAFAQAGYLAVAPDLRGYGASDRPAGVDAYSILRIVEDVIAILDAFGRERAFVVGHDFGGGVAWALAMAHPQRVERLATLNSAHVVGFERQIRKWSQLSKSWYVFFFLLPWIERVQPWTAQAIEEAVGGWLAQAGLLIKDVAQSARVALTGRTASPGLFDVVAVLGRERAVLRLRF